MASSLVAHVDARLVSLDVLAAMAQPAPMGPRHRPLRHIDLVGAVREEVARRGLAIMKERFAVGHHGATLFATFDLGVQLHDGEACWALGLRSSQDQSLALRGVAGTRVFVCDNLALRGDVFAFARRHTTALDLEATIRGGFDRYQQQAELFAREIAGLKQAELSDDRAKRVIYEAAIERVVPLRLLPRVHELYFGPSFDRPDCAPRTSWGLHNAFTRAIKALRPGRAWAATVALGRLFGLTSSH